MRRFLSEQLPVSGRSVLLSAAQSHHLLRVVGIAPDEHVILLDGRGSACEAALEGTEQGLAKLRFVALIEKEEQVKDIWFLLALTKPPAFSLALRMLTELGVHHIVPVITERSQRRNEKKERWQRIVRSAVQQCGRQHMPDLHSLQPLESALKICASVSNRFVLQPHSPPLNSTGSISAGFIGPEGGISQAELTLLHDAGWQSRGLGSVTLRADTAAVVAAGILAQPQS